MTVLTRSRNIVDELEEARAEITRLREIIQPKQLPRYDRLYLTTRETSIVYFLSNATTISSRYRLLCATYLDIENAPEEKIIDVFISKIRAKLRVRDPVMEIHTHWGRGYIMPPPARHTLKSLELR